jgi:hypothetical protein
VQIWHTNIQTLRPEPAGEDSDVSIFHYVCKKHAGTAVSMLFILLCGAKRVDAQTLLVLPPELSRDAAFVQEDISELEDLIRKALTAEIVGLEILDLKTSHTLYRSARSLGASCSTQRTECGAEIGAIADANYVISIWVQAQDLKAGEGQASPSPVSVPKEANLVLTLVSVEDKVALRRAEQIVPLGPEKHFAWSPAIKDLARSLFRPNSRLGLLEVELIPETGQVLAKNLPPFQIIGGISYFETPVGSVTVSATLDGYEPYVTTVLVEPEQRLRHQIQLYPVATEPAPPPSEPTPVAQSQETIPTPAEEIPTATHHEEKTSVVSLLPQAGMVVGAGGIGSGLAVSAFAGFSAWQWYVQNQAIVAAKEGSAENGYDENAVNEARSLIGIWEWAPVYALAGVTQLGVGSLITLGSGAWYLLGSNDAAGDPLQNE